MNKMTLFEGTNRRIFWLRAEEQGKICQSVQTSEYFDRAQLGPDITVDADECGQVTGVQLRFGTALSPETKVTAVLDLESAALLLHDVESASWHTLSLPLPLYGQVEVALSSEGFFAAIRIIHL